MATIFTEASLDSEKLKITCTEGLSGISVRITVPTTSAMGASDIVNMLSKRLPEAYTTGVTMIMESQQDD